MPIYTQSQDEFTVDAIDTVHINPSIMEGVNLFSSILSSGSAVPIVRFAPNFVVNPSITGEVAIPSTLVCNPGVVSASPSPSYLFQWRLDGVDIPGAINSTIVTDITMDGGEVTCYVEAVNFLGVASGLSNGITVTIIEPVELREQAYFIVSGLQQQNQQNLMIHRGAAITGMSLDDYQSLFTHMGYAIDGMGVQDLQIITDADFYATLFPTLLETLPLVNPGAELENTSGWTVTQGTLLVGTTLPYSGTRYFYGITNDVKYHQDVAIPSGRHSDVDAGKLMVSIGYATADANFSSFLFSDMKAYVECRDASNLVIEIIPFDGKIKLAAKSAVGWVLGNSAIEELPPLTRTIRLLVELYPASDTNGCQIDNHSINLWSVS